MISVIIPVYNTKKYLGRCLAGLLAEDHVEKELLLVDDGSTDGSSKLCDQYAGQYEYVRVIHKQNGGLMSAWMAGVKAARGEYFCFVDSDDWVEPCMLAEMEKRLSGAADEIVVCNHSIDKENGERILQRNGLRPGIYEKEALEAVFPVLLGQEVRPVSFSRCMKLISRELILDNLCYCDQRIRMGEDVNIMLPALIDTKRLVILEDAFYYHYYFNESSMVHRYDKELVSNIQILMTCIRRVMEEKLSDRELKQSLLKGADQEEILMWLLALKNEARGNPSGYRRNILKLCRSEEIRDLLKRTEITVNQPANKLLYLVMKHPGEVTVRLLRLAIIWYYRS